MGIISEVDEGMTSIKEGDRVSDLNYLKLPGTPWDEFEDDFLMLADIFPTGYHAWELANVQPGSTVAIFGAGPVGLLAAQSAFIRRASQVLVIDQSYEHLKIAEEMGAMPINFREGTPSEQILNIIIVSPRFSIEEAPEAYRKFKLVA